MHKRNYLLTLITVVMILSSTFTSAGARPPAGEGSGTDRISDPMQIHPELWETVFDKTPTFRFTQYEDKTVYRIKVRSAYDESVEYYTYKGTAKCWDFECELTPDIALPAGVVTYQNDMKGNYQWAVEAKVGPGLWSGVSTYVEFFLGTAGFNSTFTTDKKNWFDLNGTWALNSSGYLTNTGIPGEYTSALYKKRVYDDFTYTVKMKLKSVDATKHFGGIIIDGSGLMFTPPEYPTEKNVFWTGTYVVYRNNQQAAIFVWEGSIISGGLPWQTCSSIVPGGWNKIKVNTEGSTIEVSFNGTPCLTYTHPAIDENSGYVALTQYRYDTTVAEKMLVDWAKLEVDTP